MQVPELLARRIRMFRERAHAWRGENEMFQLDSWVQVMFGQGIHPANYNRMTEGMKEPELARFLEGIRTTISRAVASMPTHQEFLDRYCRASDDIWKKSAAMK
jgi:tryptophan halogenase